MDPSVSKIASTNSKFLFKVYSELILLSKLTEFRKMSTILLTTFAVEWKSLDTIEVSKDSVDMERVRFE